MGFRALRFDELEEVPWKPGLTLRPVRRRLEQAIAQVPELRREAESDPLLAG